MNAVKKSRRSRFFQLPAGALAAALIACSPVGPDYRAPQPEMPAQWGEAPTAVQIAPAETIRRWWTLFQDPVLDSLIARAVVANPDLLIAETRIREARAQRRLTAAAGLPALGVGASANSSRRSENISSSDSTRDLFQTDFDAAWEIDVFGGTRRQVEAADANLAAAVEDRRDVLVTLEAEVARNYLELRTSRQRRAIALETIRTQEQTVALVQGRWQLGLGAQLETVQAQTQLSLTRSQVPALETAAIQAMHRLALLLGRQPQALKTELAGTTALPPIPPRLPTSLPSDLLRQRPDIRSAERQLAAATATVGAATAELFPRFSLSALLGLQSASLADLIAGGSRFWSVGPAVSWPLFDGGRARATIEISEARRDRARATYEKSVLTALAEAEDALVALDREQTTRGLLSEAVVSSQQAVEIARGQYTAGLTPFLNVLISENTLYQSQDRLALSNQQLAVAMITLFKALGGGWQAEATPAASSLSNTASEPRQHARNHR